MNASKIGGEPLVPVAGDTTRAGVQYTNINGVPLAVPVDMQGGFQYPEKVPKVKTTLCILTTNINQVGRFKTR